MISLYPLETEYIYNDDKYDKDAIKWGDYYHLKPNAPSKIQRAFKKLKQNLEEIRKMEEENPGLCII
ncbi:MAG: hypothetical protein LBU09_00130 [Endomicrobium sp.]|jgi:hypothetical protein|nr:hypothetical protein [Endomicrobium sp.]